MNELSVAAFSLAMFDEPRRTQPPNQLAPSHTGIITQRQVSRSEGSRGLAESLTAYTADQYRYQPVTSRRRASARREPAGPKPGGDENTGRRE